MDKVSWASILVAIIGVVSAWLSGKSARNAQKYSAKTQAETDAYTRARKMDTETIERQDKELEQLRKENEKLRAEVRQLRLNEEELSEQNLALRRRVSRLERAYGIKNE